MSSDSPTESGHEGARSAPGAGFDAPLRSPLEASPPVYDPTEELPLPIGTLFLTMLYIMVIAGMWASIYFEFIGR